MGKVKSTLVAAAAALLIAGVVSAQNADQNTGGPTKNTLRLKLVEPREGQEISGSSIRVAVDYNRTGFGQGQGTKFGEANFPQPRFDVYLDNSLKETLKGGEKNVAEITNVSPGKHKIAVVAKNVSGEIIDRAEVTVTNVAGTAAAEATTSDQTTSAFDDGAGGAAACSSTTSTPAPAPEHVGDRRTTAPSTTSTSDALPRTGSKAPAAALLGATLLAAGVFVSRRRV